MQSDSVPEGRGPASKKKDPWLEIWLEGRVKGRHEAWDEGWYDGMRIGKAELISALLRQRFGALSVDTQVRLIEATAEDLQAWGEVLLDAPTLDDVFTRGESLLKDWHRPGQIPLTKILSRQRPDRDT